MINTLESTGQIQRLWVKGPGDEVHLCASVRSATGQVYFPPLPKDSPISDEFSEITLSAEGTLYSFTEVHPSPKSGQPSYMLSYVDFPEKVRVFGRLVMVEKTQRPQIGMRVVVGLEEKGDGTQRYIFSGEPANV